MYRHSSMQKYKNYAKKYKKCHLRSRGGFGIRRARERLHTVQPKVRKAYICHKEKVKTEYKTENVNH